MAAAMIRAALMLALTAAPAMAQDFAFRQDCQLTLSACDMMRDGDPAACPVGLTINARFWTEGDAFYLQTPETNEGGPPQTFALGQGYFTDAIRLYYVKDHPTLDGMFWIADDGTSGAQFSYDGQEDYFDAVCTPMPD
jgi:hypothetical protein